MLLPACMATYYARLLGLPDDVVTPDYFQLLGLSRAAPIDEEHLVDALAERLDRLVAATPDERSIVQHLTRELQRARATLLDPRGRAGHLEEVKQRRLREVPKYVAALLDGERALPHAAEQALLDRAPALDVPRGELKGAIDDALDGLQATRGEGRGELDGADERVLEVMREVADDQLRVDAGLTASAEAPPPRRAREPSARAAEVPAEKDTTDEAVHWSPTRPGAPASREAPAPANAPERATPWAPVIVSPDSQEQRDRGARRWQRTYLALGLLGLAFVAGDLAAAFLPVEATWLDARTAGARARLWASPDLLRYAAGAAGAACALFGLMVWLAGRPARRPFTLPLAVLALPLAYAGLVPVGHERAVLLERDALARDRDVLVLQTRAVSAVRDAALRRETSTVALVTTLAAARAHLEEELAARARQVAERSERVTLLERSLRRQDDTVRRLRRETTTLQAELAVIRSTTTTRADASLEAPVTPPAASVAPATRR